MINHVSKLDKVNNQPFIIALQAQVEYHPFMYIKSGRLDLR